MYKETLFRLTTGMLDEFDKLRPYTILDLFQEMAGSHAEELGVGYDSMLEKGYNWVITKNKFIVNKYPKPSEVVNVCTWPIIPGRADFDRAYLIKNLNGEVLVEGLSKWCVIDSITHRIIRSDKVKFNGEYISTKSNLEFERGVIIEKSELDFVFDYLVTPSMLDHYHHMNNAKYAEVVLDVVRSHTNNQIQGVQINNFNEVKCGEIIKVYNKKIDGGILVYGYTISGDCYDKLAFNAIIKVEII